MFCLIANLVDMVDLCGDLGSKEADIQQWSSFCRNWCTVCGFVFTRHLFSLFFKANCFVGLSLTSIKSVNISFMQYVRGGEESLNGNQTILIGCFQHFTSQSHKINLPSFYLSKLPALLLILAINLNGMRHNPAMFLLELLHVWFDDLNSLSHVKSTLVESWVALLAPKSNS